ncbi:unnamed protein product, partial [Ceratitis capitata]
FGSQSGAGFSLFQLSSQHLRAAVALVAISVVANNADCCMQLVKVARFCTTSPDTCPLICHMTSKVSLSSGSGGTVKPSSDVHEA